MGGGAGSEGGWRIRDPQRVREAGMEEGGGSGRLSGEMMYGL